MNVIIYLKRIIHVETKPLQLETVVQPAHCSLLTLLTGRTHVAAKLLMTKAEEAARCALVFDRVVLNHAVKNASDNTRTCAVDQHIDAAVLCSERLEQFFNRRGMRDVATKANMFQIMSRG